MKNITYRHTFGHYIYVNNVCMCVDIMHGEIWKLKTVNLRVYFQTRNSDLILWLRILEKLRVFSAGNRNVLSIY